MSESDSPRTLKTLSRAVKILNTLMRLDGAQITELAEIMDMNRGTIYTYLRTLEQEEMVVQNGNQYELAYTMLVYGEYVRNQSTLYRAGKEYIDELAAKTGQYSHIVVEEKGRGVNLYKSRGEEAVGSEYQSAKFQQRDFLHITASGKAILASLATERVDEIIDEHGLPKRTEHTITNRQELFDELADIRERGYSINDEEEIEGFRAVGAPITDRSGDVIGSLSVSGPTSIFDGDRVHNEIPELVIRTANLVELNMNMADRSEEITEQIP
ncbi:IclR family transcriptional regulator [Natronococcus occultus]|uniref:Transcriptional regulator n=1 Tax=Natronococcus occultus SP4 TaxID=694430 RepID=L0K1M9_9EURY|nr:IclR family transcriptional regulator [Natronococcus occultus]AGB38886.1 transcriptional regulator [Natronococcus occultus SP4]